MPEQNPTTVVQNEVPPTPQKDSFLKNKTPILVLFLLLITGILVYMALSPKRGPGTETQNISPAAQANTKLSVASAPYLSEEEISTTSAKTYLIDVNADTGENAITGVQLELNYEPKDLNVIDILPGDLIKEAVTVLKKIDKTNGTISYAIATPLGAKGVKGSGVVAKIKFQAPLDLSKTIGFSFDGKTVVTTDATTDDVLRETVDSSFTLNPTPAP